MYQSLSANNTYATKRLAVAPFAALAPLADAVAAVPAAAPAAPAAAVVLPAAPPAIWKAMTPPKGPARLAIKLLVSMIDGEVVMGGAYSSQSS